MQILRRDHFSSEIDMFALPSVFGGGSPRKSPDEFAQRQTNVSSAKIDHLLLTSPIMEPVLPKKKKVKLTVAKEMVDKATSDLTLPTHERQLQPTHKLELKPTHKQQLQAESKHKTSRLSITQKNWEKQTIPTWYILDIHYVTVVYIFKGHSVSFLLFLLAAKGSLSKTTCYCGLEMEMPRKRNTRPGNISFCEVKISTLWTVGAHLVTL